MGTPRRALSLETLLDQVNRAWPQRSKASDGWIGDQAHQTRPSDHNPNAAGVVTAIDITHDPGDGCDVDRLFANIIRSRDTRVKYLIRSSRILRSYPKPGTIPWQWSPYTGDNPHNKHGHISVSEIAEQYDNPRPWRITAPEGHKPPWVLLHGRTVLATGRFRNPAFTRKVSAALRKYGKVTLKEKS